MNSGPVVILTALNREYEAVRNRLTDLLVHRHPAGTRFEVGRLGTNGCRVALGLVGKGNHSAAVLAEGAMVESPPPRRSSSVSLGISDRADGSKTATDGENDQRPGDRIEHRGDSAGRRSPRALSQVALDASGLIHTLNVLEGIAAVGKEWIRHQRRRADERLAELTATVRDLID